MSNEPVRVAALGMGWWSDVLADAVGRSDSIEIVSCFTRSEDKRAAFAEKYGCTAVASYEEMLADDSVEAIINTTPNSVHLETVRQAAEHGAMDDLRNGGAVVRQHRRGFFVHPHLHPPRRGFGPIARSMSGPAYLWRFGVIDGIRSQSRADSRSAPVISRGACERVRCAGQRWGADIII